MKGCNLDGQSLIPEVINKSRIIRDFIGVCCYICVQVEKGKELEFYCFA